MMWEPIATNGSSQRRQRCSTIIGVRGARFVPPSQAPNVPDCADPELDEMSSTALAQLARRPLGDPCGHARASRRAAPLLRRVEHASARRGRDAGPGDARGDLAASTSRCRDTSARAHGAAPRDRLVSSIGSTVAAIWTDQPDARLRDALLRASHVRGRRPHAAGLLELALATYDDDTTHSRSGRVSLCRRRGSPKRSIRVATRLAFLAGIV